MHDIFVVEGRRKQKIKCLVICRERRVESKQLKFENIRLTMWKCCTVETFSNVESMKMAIVKKSTKREYRG